jgi:hypothetical protein
MRVWSILGVLVKGQREAVGLLVGGGMALLCGLIFAILGASSLVREYEFMTNSTTGIAEVIGKGRTGQKDFFVDCRLLSFAGANHYEKRIPVYSGLWQNLRKGQALNVDYLRNDPANMRLQGSIGNLGDAFLHLLIGTMLAVIGIVVSPIAIQFLIRQNRERKADE